MLMLLMTLAFVAGCMCHKRWCSSVNRKVQKNKKTQSQVTYTRYLQTPRFKPLMGKEDGAWSD